jgi:hypothetical protein
MLAECSADRDSRYFCIGKDKASQAAYWDDQRVTLPRPLGGSASILSEGVGWRLALVCYIRVPDKCRRENRPLVDRSIGCGDKVYIFKPCLLWHGHGRVLV